MIFIDAAGLIVGRLATKVAKLALNGENIAIVNCENAVISGKQQMIVNHWREKEWRTQPFKGPFIAKMPDRMVKRVIRGMLPRGKSTETSRGRAALKRIMCYLGVPAEFKDKSFMKIEGADATGLKTQYQITVGELARLLKAKGKGK